MGKPRHPDAAKFLKDRLFDDLDSFRTLEKRIAALPEEDRGMAFEVFAEGYFNTVRQEQASEVWPSSALPPEERDKLGLLEQEVGVDGVIETHTGEYRAYQAKFRSNKSLVVGDIANLFLMGNRADRQVLITNCTQLPDRVLNKKRRYLGVQGNHLDCLSKADFERIRKWLKGAKVTHERKKPYRFQEKAITKILAGLADNDRVTATMACGTGKTLVALWVAQHKQLKARNVLFLVPSLALLKQTLEEWAKESEWKDLDFLAVCSDSTVGGGVDNWVIRPWECGFPVTTDSDEVRKELSRPCNGTRLVFSTYHSAEALADGMPPSFRFDLGIFDEAHKTAGIKGRNYSFALSDENMKIKKRLFMTATPRHYHPRNRNADEDFTLQYSMDDREVYGPVVYDLPFSEAADDDIICHYKVLISAVLTNEASDALKKRKERVDVLVEGDPVAVRQVANQISIQRAVEEYGMRKIISFHGTIAAAKSFTSDLPEGIGTHLDDFKCFHVNGGIPTGKRAKTMKEFRFSDRGIVSNAACLTEGVDVPAVDMVAFMAPKRSKIDIVQAVGRAMRTSPETGKTVGYVLVPLHLELGKNESIDEALERTDFEQVGAVLNAMQTQDVSLVDVIGGMREERGRTGGFSDSLLRDYVEVLGPEISLAELRKGITTQLVNQLGVTWDERYGELLAYKEEHGDCLVAQGWSENPQLGTWVLAQRNLKKAGRLTKDRTRKLDDIEFNWDPHSTRWEQMYEELVAYKNKHGNCLVAQKSENKQLATWVVNQRSKRSKLPDDQIQRLDDIGFDWDPDSTRWEQMYEELVAYKNLHGNCLVSRQSENPQLGNWVINQRFNHDKLPEDRRQRLDDVGFVWDVLGSQWEEMYAQLVAYKNKHGNFVFLKSENEQLSQLSSWAQTQRLRKNDKGGFSALTKARVQRLDDIGFDWDPATTHWERMYKDLVAYKDEQGDCLVPVNWPENPELGTWVSTRRGSRDKLPEDQLQRLDDIGFVWDVGAHRFERMYKDLVAYKNKHGNCRVPQKWPANRQLGIWVSTRRASRDKLPEDQLQKLDDIGFDWDLSATTYWEQMYKELTGYKNKHGNCRVPQKWAENPRLGRWVSKMRSRHSKLPDDQIQRLDDIGFNWAPHSNKWEQMYEELVAYKEEHGDCLVVQIWTENPGLGRWVSRMRREHSKLPDDQIQRLDDIGFDWDPDSTQWEKRYSQLVAYKDEHGDCFVRKSENPQLDTWVSNQRSRRGRLTKDQIQSLDDIGLVWDVDAHYFEQMYKELVTYRDEHGDCLVPRKWPENPQLGTWVGTRRSSRDKLPDDQIQKFDDIGFDWDPATTKWEQMCEQLVAYKKEHGDCLVVDKWPENPHLGTWVSSQRSKRSKLSEDQLQRLDGIGFDWDPATTKWEKMYTQLVAYKEEYGNCLVPDNWAENSQLGTWVSNSRVQRSKLSEDRLQRLDDIGFVWDVLASQWEQMYEQLVAYKEEYGDCLVTKDWPGKRRLGSWVGTQRTRRKAEKISEDQRQKLDDIGFDWDPATTKWEKMYKELVAYKKEHGDCLVAEKWPENPELGTWVSTRRSSRDKLPEDQRQRLDDIGFVWDAITTKREQMYKELVTYKDEHGDCLVPQKWPENQELATWVSTRRSSRDKLPEDQRQRLDDIGFVWDVDAHYFEQMCKELVTYRDEHGNCRVPQKWPENPQLGTWVSKQRSKQSKLSGDQFQRLDDIGFDWDPRRTQWEKMYSQLVAYKKEHGSCLIVDKSPENPQLGTWVSKQRSKRSKLSEDQLQRLDDIGFVWGASAFKNSKTRG